MGVIYFVVSTESGKGYIGQSTNPEIIRWRQHIRDAEGKYGKDKCRALNAAILKYGKDNFTHRILATCSNDKLDLFEEMMIKIYKTLSPGGYNLTTGGCANKLFSEESKELMRISQLAYGLTKPKYANFPKTELPKYIIRWSRHQVKAGNTYDYEGFAIHKHPECKFKAFLAKDKTLDEKLQQAIEYLKQL